MNSRQTLTTSPRGWSHEKYSTTYFSRKLGTPRRLEEGCVKTGVKVQILRSRMGSETGSMWFRIGTGGGPL